MRFKKNLKTISILTLCLFTATTAVEPRLFAQALGADGAQLQFGTAPQKFSPEYFLSLSRQLPTELGQLGAGFLPLEESLPQLQAGVASDRTPFVIHIQDAHSNVEAQERIYGILNWIESLHEEYKIQSPLVVAAEGAVRQIHPEYLELFPQFPQANEAFVESLKEKGELGGVELYAWEKYKQYKNGEQSAFRNVVVHGVEDADAYRDNLKFYRALIFKKGDINALLRPLSGQLSLAQSFFLNNGLREFLKDMERPDIISGLLLKHISETLKINLADGIEQIRFPNLSRIVYLKKIEPLLDRELARMEWESFKKRIPLERIEPADLNILEGTLNGESQTAFSLRKILERLYEELQAENLPFDEFPYLTQWLGFEILSQELDSAGFGSELKQVQRMIMARLAKTEKEKAFLSLYESYRLFERLLHGELTRAEFEAAAEDAGSVAPETMTAKINGLLADSPETYELREQALKNEPTLNKAFRLAWEFYEGAVRRDQSLLRNALNIYAEKRSQLSPEEDEGTAGILVLVSGGFHSGGLEHAMREQNVPHIVITPRISKVSQDNLYEKVMLRAHADLSGYFSEARLSKQEALFLRGLIEDAAPKLTEIYGVEPDKIPNWVDQVIKRHPVLQRHLDSIVLSNQERPFARVSVKNPGAAVQADVQGSAVPEVYLTLDAPTYDHLSSFSFVASGDSVRLNATPSGYLRIEREEPDTVSIVTAAGSDLSKGVLKQSALITQVSQFAASGLFSGAAGRTGLPKRVVPQRGIQPPVIQPERNELRTRDTPHREGVLSIDDQEPDQNVINRIVMENDVIYVRADAHQDITYLEYRARLMPYIEMMGKALKEVRHQEWLQNESRARRSEAPLPPVHKVFVFKTWTDAGSTERFFDEIKYAREPSDAERGNDYNFDVVFQPDFSFTDREGVLTEPQVVFGLRDYEDAAYKSVNASLPVEEAKPLEDARRERTVKILEENFSAAKEAGSLYFTNVRNAEKVKDDLILYLSAKLAHFNDLALLSSYYGADLSAVAFGAGLDKRIRTPFTNPSLGFGGRLSRLLDWISEAEIEHVLPRLESKPQFFPGTMRAQGRQEKIQYIHDIISRSIRQLREIAEKPSSGLTIFEILQNLPEDLHYLFLLQTIVAINKQNIKDFTSEVTEYVEKNRKVRRVAILGAAYREGDPKVTKSPVKALISDLVKSEKADVVEFYIADPVAREELAAWLERKKTDEQELEVDTLGQLINQRRIRFIGIDEGTKPLSITEAVKQSDIAVIVTDSNPELKRLQDPDFFKEFVAALGDKPLFDGINFAGLRADGSELLPISRLREAGVNYYSVGRPGLGAFQREKLLLDSVVIGRELDKTQPETEAAAIDQFQRRILELETDEGRRRQLTEQFALETVKDEKAYATDLTAKKIAVIGGGYVGLTTGGNLADLGNDVTVVDIPEKLAAMEALDGEETVLPIHEPGLKELVERGKASGKLRFRASVEDRQRAVRGAQIIYLAVGTPQQDNGAQDPVYILEATSQIAEIIKEQQGADPANAYKTIVIKSTVTPQVFQDIAALLRDKYGLIVGRDYGLVSNPEFLREGQAIKDITVDLDRTVLGFYSEMSEAERRRVEKDILETWYPLMRRTPHTVLLTDTATSTMIKYAANAYLAVSISEANVFADSAVRAQANFLDIASFLRRDPRIGKNAFLACGPGYGGSCFPKDVRALNYLSFDRIVRDVDIGGSLEMIVFADQMNQYFKVLPLRHLIRLLSGGRKLSDSAALQSKRIAILGMAFKEDTDDMRESQTAHLLAELLKIEAAGLDVHVDDAIHREPNAPPFAVNVSRFEGELYKHFKNEAAFNKGYAAFKSGYQYSDEELVTLYNSVRGNARFRRLFSESLQRQVPADVIDAFLNRPLEAGQLTDENTQFYWQVIKSLVRKQRIPDDLLKLFYFENIFLGKLVREKRLNFVNGIQDAVIPGGKAVDAVLIMTPWKEYRTLPDYLQQIEGAKPLIVDARGFLTREQVEDLASRGFSVFQPGREDILPLNQQEAAVLRERNELRQANDALQLSIASFRETDLNTGEFHQLFNSLIIGPLQGIRTPEDLIRLFPELGSRHAVRTRLAAGFIATDFFKDVMVLAAVRYIQITMSAPGELSDEKLEAVEAVREALGPFNWLLDRSDVSIRVIAELKPHLGYTDLFRLTAVLAAANPNSEFAFMVENAAPNDARQLAAFLAEKMVELKLPADRLLSQFKFMPVADDDRALARAVKQVYSEDPRRVSATLADSVEFLEKLGYVPNMTRLHQDLDLQIAISITAALLRQLDDPLQVLSVQGIGQQFGLDIDLLIERIGHAIQVLGHLATQA